MIIFLIEMLKLPNFGQMITFTIQFELLKKILFVTSQSRIITSKNLFQKVLILRKPGRPNFADIIKIVTVFIKKMFKDSKKVKRIRNCVPKFYLYLYFLI